MGLILFPWVIIYGLTGLYMNHGDLILSLFPRDHIEQALVDDQPGLRGDAERHGKQKHHRTQRIDRRIEAGHQRRPYLDRKGDREIREEIGNDEIVEGGGEGQDEGGEKGEAAI